MSVGSPVIWHDLECGRYEEDLPVWLGLAAEHAAAPDQHVLDVGAGTGRVAIPLARAGHRVVALDRDPELLSELERRAARFPVEPVCADAREFSLPGRSFALIAAPMQTVQLLGGRAGQLAFLERACEHLAPGGVVAVAFALADDFEPFEWQEGDMSPLPDIAELDGCAYFSQPTAVRASGGTFVLERRREVVDASGQRSTSSDRIELDVLDVEDLRQLGEIVGLGVLGVQHVAPTDEHIGSQVVILGG